MNIKAHVLAVKSIPYKIQCGKYKKREEKGNNTSATKKIFTHITYYAVGNAGDTVLSQCVRRMFETTFSVGWAIRGVNEEVDYSIVSNMNSTNAVIVGGGGLFLPDTNANSVSGWQWAISKRHLQSISVPVIGYSIGYNFFPGQQNSKIFVDNLRAFCEMAAFIGLRNNGSVLAVKALLPEKLRDKICYQPCTTTLIRKLYDLPDKEKSKKVAINMAFDREQIRFGNDREIILDQVARFAKALEEKGYQIVLVYHMKNDKKIIPYMRKRKVSFKQKDLTFAFPDEVYQFYNGIELVAGMRGHAQMIPFGLNCEIISLGTHDKMKWFLEDINAMDWYVDLRSDPSHLCNRLLERFIDIHENRSDATKRRLIREQDRLWEISCKNMTLLEKILRNA